MTDLFHHLTLFLREVQKKDEKALIVICGPTASGKTSLSLAIAKHFDGEIISADSAQVYKKMNIGTDKVTVNERKQVKHHLIDIRNPDQNFTMADFKREATQAIEDIHRRKKVPIICGGTGLYINSVIQNYELPAAPPNQEIRDELQAEYEKGGKEKLYKMLLDLDPASAAKIHPNNVRYVARALEIVLQTKKPKPSAKGKPPYHVFKIAISWDREILYERINNRIDEQIEEGLLNEIKSLQAEGYGEELQSMSALGYKEYFPYLKGDKPLEECKDQLKQNTRNFAKRQFTWFRKEEDLYWIEPEEFFALTKESNAS
ncbi:tRNA (adenosine(37)-N6)-dimethylallyltransferase MiaA [Candidatus Peregrinibacteria bacterium]|nr:tRNA (adenosine(37)-N6)-dimethylallyltransferase MiaA [Candidatus Peregrinibacteria bacterium]MBT4631466.1 tRNA (adenosine(37)-N6)-dimethylallyltransferase MiaA [Candidatus Peregrinibacteria bacterium]